jgi:hypothetical protein
MSKDKPQTEIFEYIRRRHNGKTVKVGVIVGTTDEGHGVVKVGWSKCNVRLDTFEKDVGLKLARERCKTPSKSGVPACVKRQYRQFAARCVRYFKDAHTVKLDMAL